MLAINTTITSKIDKIKMAKTLLRLRLSYVF